MKPLWVDNQLPAALSRWLQDRGHPSAHVLDLNLGQAPDSEIWSQAARAGAVILSKDEDFAQMTLFRPEPVCVIWLRIGNCRTTHLLALMERSWPRISAQLETGARLIEVH